MVADAEAKIGFTPPKAYLELLRVQNGGYIRYQLPDLVHEVIAGIGPHFPSLTDLDLDRGQDYVSFSLEGLVPFDGDGHWFLCLDYRGGGEPRVTLVDIECDSEEVVADSFAGYLDLLELDVGENYFALVDVPDIDDVKRYLADDLSLTFDEPDAWAHGYLEHRANCSDSDSPEWLWISPNLVPRGFVRPDDNRFDELRMLLPGTARRYNELGDRAYILSATDGVRERILNSLRNGSISFTPMNHLSE